jgi:copper chaperone
MERLTMKIEGMSCGHCVAAVNQALDAVDGVEVEYVGIGTAAIAFDPARTTTDSITQAVADEGYTVVSTETAAPR